MAETAPEKQPWAHRVTDALDKLTTATTITWGSDGDWRKSYATALERLSLPGLEDESLPPLVIEKEDRVWLDSEPDPKESEYLVTNAFGGSYGKKVPVASVRVSKPGWSVPNHETAPITLLCYELFPYAALHAGLMSAVAFFKAITNARESKSVDGSITWAAFLGAKLTRQPPPIDLRANYGRGDIIVFCDKHGDGFHAVTASGETDQQGRPMVYSLSSDDKKPGRFPLGPLVTAYQRETYMQAFTPRDPDGY